MEPLPVTKKMALQPLATCPGNAFPKSFARTVHKVETSPFERLAVLNGVVQTHIWIALARRANGLEHDIVQTAKFVATGGIALG